MKKFDNKITFEALESMDYLHCCMKEALRLYPPLILLMRKVKKSIRYKDYIIPKDDIVVTCPPISHRIESVFPDPEKFDPDRFFERKEGGQRHDFIAFGQGKT